MNSNCPPPLITLIAVVMVWLVSIALPQFAYVVSGHQLIPAVLGITGLVLSGLGVVAFRRAVTTSDLRQPANSTSLVTSGIYRVTRNPMYLGLVCLLLGWTVYLSNVAALLVVPVFIMYMARFQIRPEERALARRFPQAFAGYCRTVCRWL